MSQVLGLYNYWIFLLLLMLGLYVVASQPNLVKKLIGMSIFQSAVFLLYITMDKVDGGTAPIIENGTAAADVVYSNPLPQVLILTAIVVGIATLAVGLAVVVRIHEAYGSIEEDEIREMDRR